MTKSNTKRPTVATNATGVEIPPVPRDSRRRLDRGGLRSDLGRGELHLHEWLETRARPRHRLRRLVDIELEPLHLAQEPEGGRIYPRVDDRQRD